jgi:MSHA biogenesis protein MshP
MNKQAGFSMVMVIFILVVLGLLGGYMVRLSGVQHATSTYAIQGARAYQAARAGIGWGLYRLTIKDSCVSSSVITLPDINGFSVNISCSDQSTTYNEGDLNRDKDLTNDDFYIYLIQSAATYGSFSDSNFIHRKLEVTVKK